MGGKKAIICVDDEKMILTVLKNILKDNFSERFIYESAESADEAIELIEELKKEGIEIELVITDWLMPGKKGDEFIDEIFKMDSSIKTIMISGQTDESALFKIKRSPSLKAFLSKPWTDEDLLSEIEKCLASQL